MRSQISRTSDQTPAAWFKVEKAWTKEILADVSLALTSYREGGVGDEMWNGDDDEEDDDDEDDDDDDDDEDEDPNDPASGPRRREIALVVQDGRRLSREDADSVFAAIATEIENAPELKLKRWKGGELGGERRMVWNQRSRKASRKVVRPIVERAVERWYGQPIFSRGQE